MYDMSSEQDNDEGFMMDITTNNDMTPVSKLVNPDGTIPLIVDGELNPLYDPQSPEWQALNYAGQLPNQTTDARVPVAPKPNRSEVIGGLVILTILAVGGLALVAASLAIWPTQTLWTLGILIVVGGFSIDWCVRFMRRNKG